jgi:hypothetical protein
MATNRALMAAEHIGGNQYRLRIRDSDFSDKQQWFTFDARTQSIRSWAKRGYALSNQKGYGFRIGVAATVRPYTGAIENRIRWFNGARKNIQNNGHKCLDVHGGSNTHNRHVIFWNCHNGKNQGWTIDQTQGHRHKQPIGDNQRFQIRSRMATERALFYHEHIGGQQYRLRIQNHEPWNEKQWFIFDSRTKSIRAWKKRSFAISNQYKKAFQLGNIAVIREYRSEVYQHVSFYPGKRQNIRSMEKKCLDVHGGSNTQHRHVIWWSCHNGANQGWTIDTKGIHWPKYPLNSGLKFQIRSMMKGGRALKFAEHIGAH